MIFKRLFSGCKEKKIENMLSYLKEVYDDGIEFEENLDTICI